MDHLKALGIKFVMIAAVLLIILTLLFDVPFMDTIWTSLILTIFAYVLGDFILFRLAPKRLRNIMATITDLIISFLVIWYMLIALTDANENLAVGAIISAIVIALGELFYHKYLDRTVFVGKHISKLDEVKIRLGIIMCPIDSRVK
ncbi:hypothetical protein AM499_19715 [Bacillus sp. FJAT-22090]|uniref:DUF2512 family protein n=1 Tax=Bacillus sp. FJAT-22090 TaxID=1581038 RepID=UPI0006B02291|nr:DUF2512 family protein [Bacillus sp. FJAT-22090]ALC87784.1 hypothetical protein AM499_19715 [Bacillus sp. FJAT-22090]